MKICGTAMVFGVFDVFHEGHRHFLSQAMALCEKLIVVVTLPEVVEEMKGNPPRHSLQKRMSDILDFAPHLHVVAGDRMLGSWEVLKAHAPDAVFLGYDQQQLGEALGVLGVRVVMLDAHRPEVYKSSLVK